MTTTAMNNEAANNAAAAQAAEGMFGKARSAVNSFIKACPKQFAEFTAKLHNVAGMSDEQAAAELEKAYTKMADTAKYCVDAAKMIPSSANAFEVKSMEDLQNTFTALANDVKNADKVSGKVKKAIKLVGTLLYIIGKKVGQYAIAAAKKLLVVGVRIAAIAGGFIITVVTGMAKAVKRAWTFSKAFKAAKAADKAREDAALTVDDLTEEDFEVEC